MAGKFSDAEATSENMSQERHSAFQSRGNCLPIWKSRCLLHASPALGRTCLLLRKSRCAALYMTSVSEIEADLMKCRQWLSARRMLKVVAETQVRSMDTQVCIFTAQQHSTLVASGFVRKSYVQSTKTVWQDFRFEFSKK
jgi:hypothetical protein